MQRRDGVLCSAAAGRLPAEVEPGHEGLDTVRDAALHLRVGGRRGGLVRGLLRGGAGRAALLPGEVLKGSCYGVTISLLIESGAFVEALLDRIQRGESSYVMTLGEDESC